MNLSTVEAFKTIKFENGIEIEGEILKKCQKVLLAMAEDFISVCEKQGYWYQLCGGTALGAVRNQGFIPWDDDIDIFVKGKDFEKIGKTIEKQFDGKYKFLYYNTPDFGLPMGRIMLNGSIYRDRDAYDSDHCGFFIDIFPIENTPDNIILRKIHGVFCLAFSGIVSCRKIYRNRKLYREIAEQNPKLRKTLKLKTFIGGALSFLPLNTWAEMADRVYGFCKDEKSIYVAVPNGKKHYFGEMYRRDLMFETIPVEFEGHQWQITKDYDGYFKILYGPDYMTPQSPEKREKHTILELKFPEEKMKGNIND